MADKIDQLKIGSTSYDIDLPPDATPSIASLTIGTAVINNNASPTFGNGSAITQPNGEAPITIRTTTSGSKDVGILRLTQDNAYIANSSDNNYTFAIFDTDKTTDFSSADNAAFAVLSDQAGVKLKGDLTVAGAITSNGSNVMTEGYLGFTASGKNYPVEKSSGGQLYVNVPWTDTTTADTWRPLFINGVDQDDATLSIVDNLTDDGTGGLIPVLWGEGSYGSVSGTIAAAQVSNTAIIAALGYTPGSSNLTIGTTSTTAAAGDHAHGNITNTGTITSTAVTSGSGILVYDSDNKIQRMADTSKMRALIGAGTSNLAIGSTSTTAAAGDHTHGNINKSGQITAVESTTTNVKHIAVCVDDDGTVKKMTPANVRTAIGAGTSSLTLGTTSTTAAAGNHTHSQYFNNTGGYALNAEEGDFSGTVTIGSGYIYKGWQFRTDGTVISDFFNIAGDTGIVLSQDVLITGTDGYAGSTTTSDLVVQNGNVYANYFYAGSDIRLKENISDTTLDPNKLLDNLHIVDFNYKDDQDKKLTVGLIAQELEAILPEKYHDSFIQIKHKDENNYLNINETKLVYIALLALKDQKKKIDDLELRIKALESK